MKYFLMIIITSLLLGLSGCNTTAPPIQDILPYTDTENDALDDIQIEQGSGGSEITNPGGSLVELAEDREYIYIQQGIIDPQMAEELIRDTAPQVLQTLRDRDMEALSEFIHPEDGLRFTPFPFVNEGNDVVFSRANITNFFDDDHVYQWGAYPGFGQVIEMTPSEYYDNFVYSHDFMNAEQIGYNQVLSGGNTLENQFEVYADPIVVEYYFPGFDEALEGLDWVGLRLVFEKYGDQWLLVGIIHNQYFV